VLEHSYRKTEAGRAEIRLRQLALARGARNLLLLLDGSRSGAAWLEMVQGVGEAELGHLLELGLIERVPAAATAAAVPMAASGAAAAGPTQTPGLDYQALYAYLTGCAKEHLGLMKGYRMVLDVERCANLAELQALALQFVEQVRLKRGEALAHEVERSLGLRR